MNPPNNFLAIFIIAVSITATTSQVPRSDNVNVNSIKIGDYIYFEDSLQNRTRAEAAEFCQSEAAELAKIWNRNLFYLIRLAVSRDGAYWVDGIDRRDEYRFDFERICPHNGEFLDFSGLSANYLDLPQVSCLSLVKGTTVRNSKIAAANCQERRYVVCQVPAEGCMTREMRDMNKNDFIVRVQ